jgi:hypothetical protein
MLKTDLHEIRPDVGDLREDAARDAERRGTQTLPMAKPMKHGYAKSRGMKRSTISMSSSLMEMSSIPMLMPALQRMA